MKHIFLIFLISFSLHCCESKFTIRPAELNDISSLNTLSEKQYQNDFKPMWQKSYAKLFPHINIDAFVAEITQRNNEKNANIIKKSPHVESLRLLVAETEDEKVTKISGFCRFEKLDEKNMYMHFILVDENCRKQGIAKQLALTALKAFPTVETCRFRAHVHHKEINEIYVKHGCIQKGQVSIDLETGKISDHPNAVITHNEYVYTIKK